MMLENNNRQGSGQPLFHLYLHLNRKQGRYLQNDKAHKFVFFTMVQIHDVEQLHKLSV